KIFGEIVVAQLIGDSILQAVFSAELSLHALICITGAAFEFIDLCLNSLPAATFQMIWLSAKPAEVALGFFRWRRTAPNFCGNGSLSIAAIFARASRARWRSHICGKLRKTRRNSTGSSRANDANGAPCEFVHG